MWDRLGEPFAPDGAAPPRENRLGPIGEPWRALARVIRTALGADLRTSLRTLGRAVPICFNPAGHFRLTRLLTGPKLIGLLQRHPRLNYRYLATYLSHDFPRRTRLEIQLNHYGFLAARVRQDFFVRIYDRGFLLWSDRRGADHFSIALSFPVVGDHEGDLALVFRSEAIPIYRMSFSIVPGRCVGCSAEQTLFVGCIQGRGGAFPSIRHATRTCLDIMPAALLLAAVQGIALALGIGLIVGVGRDQAVSRLHVQRPESFFNLDEFWRSFGAEAVRDDLFLLRVPFPEKPMQLVARGHRRRTLGKRRYKRKLVQQVRECFRETCLSQGETMP